MDADIKQEFEKINGKFDNIDAKFDNIDGQFGKIGKEFKKLNNKMDSGFAEAHKEIDLVLHTVNSFSTATDQRIDNIDTRLTSIDTRLDSIDTRLGAVEKIMPTLVTKDFLDQRLGAFALTNHLKVRDQDENY